ncbi:hypothetical protein D3C75_961350 [compost metagenome]
MISIPAVALAGSTGIVPSVAPTEPTAATAVATVFAAAVSIRARFASAIAAVKAACAASTHVPPRAASPVSISAGAISKVWAQTSKAVFAGPAAAITSENLARSE